MPAVAPFVAVKSRAVESAFSPDASRLVTAPGEIFEVATGKRLLRNTRRSNTHVAWSPAGKHIATLDTSGRVDLLNAATGATLANLTMNGEGSALAFSPDGSQLVAGDWSGTLFRWSVPKGRLLDAISTPGTTVRSVFFHRRGILGATFGIIGTQTGYYAEWDKVLSGPLWSLPKAADSLAEVVPLPDGTHGLTWSRTHALTLELATGKVTRRLRLVREIRGKYDVVASVHASPVGEVHAAVLMTFSKRNRQAMFPHQFLLFNGRRALARRTSDYAHSVAFSSSGRLLALTTWKGAEIWPVADLLETRATEE